MRKSMSADFEALRRQASELGIIKGPLPIIDWDVEGSADSLRAQKFGHLQIRVIAIVPTGGYDSWFVGAPQMISTAPSLNLHDV
jgi:hypothetical protein